MESGKRYIAICETKESFNPNAANGGFFYEIQVECNSQFLFPCATAWPGSIGDPLPDPVAKSTEFIGKMS